MSRFPFPAVPNGWFSICRSEDLAAGELTSLHYLDGDLVAYRGEDGR